MPRRSTLTTRERPVAHAASGSGAPSVKSETILVRTSERIEVIDLTDRVMGLVRRLAVGEGFVNLFSMHTTCTVFVNEYQTALLSDVKRFLEDVVRHDADWLHNNPRYSDCDRMNAAAHLRAMLLGHSVTLQVSGGEVVLGQWQRVLMAELDGPRSRALRVMAFGLTARA